MSLSEFIREMPKVELHVHLQGATQPETWLELAKRNNVPLPADTVEGIREWFTFTDFRHFIDTYIQVVKTLVTPEDLELMTREFLKNQAAQHIVYSEVTYTPRLSTIRDAGINREQLAAINRARAWAEAEFGVIMGLVIDIPREVTAEDAEFYADWAINGYGNGVVAFGIGGYEPGNLPEKYAKTFARVYEAGIPCVPHAGETVGPESIWNALEVCHPVRIGHGVRCIEDAKLVDLLREKQIPLEVSPTSNICLKVYPTLAQHSLPRLIDSGLCVTINSDDPPMFNTTLTNEYAVCAETFGWGTDDIERLSLNALRASFLPEARKTELEKNFAGLNQ
ncbi:MAG: adenosine deaminase [Chloroflexota bacterium]